LISQVLQSCDFTYVWLSFQPPISISNAFFRLKAAGRQEENELENKTSRGLLFRRLGRPPGKRSDPEFEQVTAYIRKETHQAVKIELLKSGRQEFSELVEVLLQQWFKTRG
jgi:hypothetical protein